MRTIILLMLVVGLGYSQPKVGTYPVKHQMVNVLNNTSSTIASQTTSAVDLSQWTGVVTMYCYFDTAASQTTLSAITISPQVYNSLAGTWHDYYDGGTMVTIANTVWDEDYVYVNLGVFDDHTQGDSTRWVVVADTGTVRIDIGGQ